MIDSKYLEALDACNRCHCGCCKDGCPIYSTLLEEQLSARGRNLIVRAYLKGLIEANDRLARTVYSCLLCRLDEESCNARIPTAEICEQVRAELVAKGIGPLPEHETLRASIRNYGNPWMQPRSARERWIKRTGVSGSDDAPNTLYYAGCTFSLDSSIQDAPVAMVRLMGLAGVDFTLLGKEEICCGSTALRIGDRALFEELSARNRELISCYDGLVTSCAGCFKTMSQDYGLSGQPEVLHSVQLLARLLHDGRLSPGELKLRVTYHDPCHLGRHSGIYDEPREILAAIPGVELVEMRNSRELARCCGAGAGVKTARPEVSLEIAKRRVGEAEETGAEMIVSACPFCEQSLGEAVRALGKEMRVMDIAELLLMACEQRGSG